MPGQPDKDDPLFAIKASPHHFGVWVFSVLSIVFILLGVLAWQVVLSYQTQKEIALSALQLHARAIERDLERALQLGEKTLLELRLRGIASFHPDDAARTLRTGLVANTFLEDIALYNSEGIMIARGGSLRSSPLSADSPPVWASSAVSGRLATSYGSVGGFLGFAHRLDRADNAAPAGALLLLFNPLELLRPSDQPNQVDAFLIDPNGDVLLGMLSGNVIYGGKVTDFESCASLDYNDFESRGSQFSEDKKWLRMLRQLDGQPFRLIVTIPREKAFIEWTRQLGGIITITFLSILGIGLFLFLWRQEQVAERRASYLRLKAEDELVHKSRALEEINEELEQLAIAATHDLQEPLRVIGVHSQLLERRLPKDLSSTTLASLAFILRAASDMRLRVDAMRLYLNAGAPPPTGAAAWPPQDLTPVLQDVLSLLHKEITSSHAVIVAHPLPAVCLSRSDLEMLFYQIIRNGVLYQPEGQSARIEITAEVDGGRFALVTVSDNGLGIERDYWTQIFSLFKRLHQKDTYPGVGMGLAICYRIVRHAGGEICVQQSALGQGSRFAIRLPVTQDDL